MKLNNKQIKYLKGLAHPKKPVVTIGNNGLTQSVHEEIDNALNFHELIKIKLPAIVKTERINLLKLVCDNSNSISIGLTGRTAIVFRPASPGKSKFDLSQIN